jgi:hypothetical protein
MVLLFAIAVALASDLVGNAIIAGTGVGLVSGRNNTMSSVPFIQVGRSGSNQNFGTDDQVVSLFSSANYYPHILQLEDMVAFLPVQAGQDVPSSYVGNAYFGQLGSQCAPAKLAGSISFFDYGDPNDANTSGIAMSGDLEIPFDNMSLLGNISFSTNGVVASQFDFSNPEPITAVWSIPYPNASPNLQYFATLLITSLNESFVDADTYSAAASSGSLLINDGSSSKMGQPGGAYAIQVCRASLPSSFGTISAPHIRQIPLAPNVTCTLASYLCPNITIFDAGPGASINAWTDKQIATNLNSTYSNSQTLASAMAPFVDGVLFCHDCNGPGVAARVLSTFVASTASTPSFAGALQYALLHAIAATYRIELPTLNGAGSASFTLREPATLVTNPVWIYASVAYVCVLALVAVSMRRYTLSVVRVERFDSSLSVATLLAEPSPFANVVRNGSGKPAETLKEEVESEISPEDVYLGKVEGKAEGDDRFCIVYAKDLAGKHIA